MPISQHVNHQPHTHTHTHGSNPAKFGTGKIDKKRSGNTDAPSPKKRSSFWDSQFSMDCYGIEGSFHET